ncbi:MAG TPA: RNB domain-containing ribonuclease [Acidimicrobiia bacterium]
MPGDFSVDAQADARRSATVDEATVDHATFGQAREDATDIPFVTVDPTGSRDLDQAVHLTADGDGYLVHYAISDVAAFVRPDSPVDLAARVRGETLYFPDTRIPLYPTVLSEGAASLLPDVERPAALWRIGLDGNGDVRSIDLARARVRSRAQLDYAGVQRSADAGELPEALQPLHRIGELRRALARQRHAIDLDLPDREVIDDPDGTYRIQVRRPLTVELDNAEISLLTGMCAATLMMGARVGILRTVPPPDAGALRALHHAARALGIDWPDSVPPGDVLARLDRGDAREVAFVEHAASLLRGAGYVSFDGQVPDQPLHAGIGAAYAHVTAPLRRLVDRYATEVCLAIVADRPVPPWVRAQLVELPAVMHDADQRAHLLDRAVVDATEAWLLRDRVGEVFAATVIDADEHAGTILMDAPPVRARCHGDRLRVGDHITVRLVEADVVTRMVRFERAPGSTSHS